MEAALPRIAAAVDVVAARRRGGRLVYLGAGTSGRLGVLVGLAASGRTPCVVAGLDHARAVGTVGAATIAVSCNAGAEVSRHADVAIEVVTGPGVLTGSTRLEAGTAQQMVCNVLSTAAMVRTGKVYANLMVDVRPTNVKLLDRARRIVTAATGADDAAGWAVGGGTGPADLGGGPDDPAPEPMS